MLPPTTTDYYKQLRQQRKPLLEIAVLFLTYSSHEYLQRTKGPTGTRMGGHTKQASPCFHEAYNLI